jgi:hypothetical protein
VFASYSLCVLVRAVALSTALHQKLSKHLSPMRARVMRTLIMWVCAHTPVLCACSLCACAGSAGIKDDAYFELMMRNAWHMTGGEGMAANSRWARSRHSTPVWTRHPALNQTSMSLIYRMWGTVCSAVRWQRVHDSSTGALVASVVVPT